MDLRTGMRNMVWAGASLALLGIAAVAIGGIYPTVVQQFTVKPNIRDKEAPYIQHTIDFTRRAYGIDAVERTQYTAQTEVPPQSLSGDRTIVPTIRLLDPAVVNETYTQFFEDRLPPRVTVEVSRLAFGSIEISMVAHVRN